MVSIVSLQGVVALLGRFPALAGADLEVGESEIVLVQGPNGAGKSTLLRVCAGLLRIESGRAEVLGHDLVADRAAVRRSVGLLGHDTALYDDLTVEENLRFWARASRIDDEAVPAALDRLGVAKICAAERRESRGLHFTQDFPSPVPGQRHDTVLCPAPKH